VADYTSTFSITLTTQHGPIIDDVPWSTQVYGQICSYDLWQKKTLANLIPFAKSFSNTSTDSIKTCMHNCMNIL